MEKADVRCAGLHCQSAVAVPVAEVLLPRVLGALCLGTDLSKNQTRLDVESQQIGRSYAERFRAGRRVRDGAEDQLYACIRVRVTDQLLRGYES
ncbi:hypothetical protein [Streptomyces chiangmaiensis]|uniref:Uncharacterized protein n=1 Tax=Streptomyces chiangmaiensis TaxID=766497 RepID=A0ABU7FJA2_9ACTN|nr:hypothetical protein [Streptomyces chiangmaiensis]MED7824205.1 hypothetical protein [Streptomyces chiangmaiensis]